MTGRPRLVAAVLSVLLMFGGLLTIGYAVQPRTPPAPDPRAASPLPAGPSTFLRPTGAYSRSTPVRLEIPALGIDVPVTPVGLRPDGGLEVPPAGGRTPVGWYRGLPSPGESGPAVLVGHVDSARSGPAVFYRLGSLRPNERVILHRRDSRRLTFIVEAVASYPKARFPTAVVYGATRAPALRLITCGGRFDRSRGSYRNNVVVYASLAA